MSNKQTLTDDLRQRVTVQVQQDRPRLETRPELKEAVQRQRGHVRLAPALSSLLHLLFKLHPPARTHTQEELLMVPQLKIRSQTLTSSGNSLGGGERIPLSTQGGASGPDFYVFVETNDEVRSCLAFQLYLADSFHSSSSPSRCRVSISVKSVGVGPSSSSLRMYRSRSAAGDT